MKTPVIRFLSIFIVGLAFTFAAYKLALEQPHLEGIYKPGDILQNNQESITLEALDFTHEPVEILENSTLFRFYERQDKILSLLPPVPQRTSSQVPFLFWIQIFVGLGALTISAWIWSLRPKDLPTRLFFCSGISMLFVVLSSAIYTTRDLALPYSLFRPLEEFNYLASTAYAISIIGLFLVYPMRLRYWRPLLIAGSIFLSIWAVLFAMKALPMWAHGNFMIAFETILLCVALIMQFRATKKHPVERAALKWLGLSVLIGVGGFVILHPMQIIMGREPAHPGYALLFFLVIYLGLAAGLIKFRLFEVGHWAFRFLFYISAAIVFALADALFIFTLGIDRLPAIGLSLIGVGFLYLPLRDVLWRVIAKRHYFKPQEVLDESMHIALAPTASERADRWRTLLKKNFDPLQINESECAGDLCELQADGTTLLIPAVASAPAMKLVYPWAGTGLFDPQTLKLTNQLVALIRQAESNRNAYDRGVNEERQRMAQDLHDDVGARLLTGLYTADEKTRPTLQGAIADIRSIVKGLSGEKTTISAMISDLRYESERRLNVAKIHVEWPLHEENSNFLDYHQYKAVTSSVREAISNIIRHSKATQVYINTNCNERNFTCTIKDNGCGFAIDAAQSGNGLRNIQRRFSELNGTIEIQSSNEGTLVFLSFPFNLD